MAKTFTDGHRTTMLLSLIDQTIIFMLSIICPMKWKLDMEIYVHVETANKAYNMSSKVVSSIRPAVVI